MSIRKHMAWAWAAALWPCSALAAQDTDAFQVTATVVAACDVNATGDLAFGDYNPVSSTPLTASTDVEIICTNGTTYEVALDEGAGVGATVADRRMTRAGGATLSYALYQDSLYSDIWGETVSTDTVPGAGDGTTQTLTIYGRAPINQTSIAGAYTDTITVTVIY